MKVRRIVGFTVLVALLLVPLLFWTDHWAGTADATSRTAYLVRSSVVGAAGSPGVSAGKRVVATAGQPTPIGVGSAAGKVLYAGFWDRIAVVSAVEEDVAEEAFAERFDNRLFQNIPNPFNPLTAIQYSVSKEGLVDLTIYSVEGEHIRTLVHDHHAPGLFSAVWDGRDGNGQVVSSGVYFYRMTAEDYSDVRKMLILK